MFVLVAMKDLVEVKPWKFAEDRVDTVSSELNKKLANKVSAIKTMMYTALYARWAFRYIITLQWRAPSLERGVSRVGNFFLETHCISMYLCTCECASPEHPVGDNGEG